MVGLVLQVQVQRLSCSLTSFLTRWVLRPGPVHLLLLISI